MADLTFLDGTAMPSIGLGTWRAEPSKVYDAVIMALDIGYRHIDCAMIYHNEDEVGRALQHAFANGIVAREDVWITTKLWNNSHDPQQVEPALREQLSKLRLEYVDLYLVHWPVAFAQETPVPKSSADLIFPDELPLWETWKGMEGVLNAGLTRHIGVSNCSQRHLSDLLSNCAHAPEMNQIEIHPHNPQSELIEFCRRHNVHVTAYASLGSRGRPTSMIEDNEPDLLSDPRIQDIAMRRGMSPAQVLLSWALAKNIAVIPKSTRRDHLEQNLSSHMFSMSSADLAQIDSIDSRHRYVQGDFWAFPGSPYTTEWLWD